MRINFSKKFERKFKKCPQEIKNKFIERLRLFQKNKHSELLNNHSLSGKMANLRSINISGDWRAIFEDDREEVTFMAIGTHSQLYE